MPTHTVRKGLDGLFVSPHGTYRQYIHNQCHLHLMLKYDLRLVVWDNEELQLVGLGPIRFTTDMVGMACSCQ